MLDRGHRRWVCDVSFHCLHAVDPPIVMLSPSSLTTNARSCCYGQQSFVATPIDFAACLSPRQEACCVWSASSPGTYTVGGRWPPPPRTIMTAQYRDKQWVFTDLCVYGVGWCRWQDASWTNTHCYNNIILLHVIPSICSWWLILEIAVFLYLIVKYLTDKRCYVISALGCHY